jgi:Zn-dependent peptidase ImmA (M78 family)
MMRMSEMPPRYSLAKRLAADLLKRGRVRKAPIPVEKLAALLNAEIVLQPFSGEISGIIHRNKDGRAVIGVNSSHPIQRQRFTIAHEIGHLLLHTDENLHVDKNFPIGLRSGSSSKAEDENEIEANQFAAALLMPADFISRDVAPLIGKDVLIAIGKLARKYGVSEQAMSIRLSVLGHVELGT